MPAISIIMPLYNAEKYLKESLISIQNQVFTDYELICINDASTDSTLEIVNEFKRRDKRIKVHSNTERSGAAISRNYGIHAACGKYLSFLDGDDIFDEMLLENAYRCAEATDADIVMFDAKHVPSDSIYNKLKVVHSDEFVNKYCKRVFSIQEDEPYEVMKWLDAPWNKLYKSDLVKKNSIEFQNLPCFNDVCFVSLCIMTAQRVIFKDTPNIMVYVRDHFVPTRISFDRDPMCGYYAMFELCDQLLKRNRFDKLYEHYYVRLFYVLTVIVSNTKNEQRRLEFYNFLKREGIRNIRSISESYYLDMNEHTRKLLEQFEVKNYETGWYLKSFKFEIYLYYQADAVFKMFNDFNNSNNKIGVWGAGKNGEVFLEFCYQYNLKVDAVIDISEEKQGNVISTYMVVSPEECLDSIQVILVTPNSICEKVKETVGERNIKIIDLPKFLNII